MSFFAFPFKRKQNSQQKKTILHDYVVCYPFARFATAKAIESRSMNKLDICVSNQFFSMNRIRAVPSSPYAVEVGLVVFVVVVFVYAFSIFI